LFFLHAFAHLALLEPQHSADLRGGQIVVEQRSDLFERQSQVFEREDAIEARRN